MIRDLPWQQCLAIDDRGRYLTRQNWAASDRDRQLQISLCGNPSFLYVACSLKLCHVTELFTLQGGTLQRHSVVCSLRAGRVCIVETISLGRKPVLLWGSGEMVDNPSSLFERAAVRRKLTINAIRNMKQDTAGGLIGGKNGRPSVRL
jgi:hypothetical protein